MTRTTSRNNEQSPFNNLAEVHDSYSVIVKQKLEPLYDLAFAIKDDVDTVGLEVSDRLEFLRLADALAELVNCILLYQRVPQDLMRFLECALPMLKHCQLPDGSNRADYFESLMEWLSDSYEMEFNLCNAH